LLNVPTRKVEVEAGRLSEHRADEAPTVERLQKEISAARGDLELRTEELQAAQARVTELEQRLRLIHESRPYRFAWRVWRVRARTRGSLSRLRPGASRPSPDQAGAEPETLGLDEVLYAAAYSEVSSAPLRSAETAGGEQAAEAKEFYYGSRGVRATEPEQTGPLRAVLLLGALTEPQLDSALRALDRHGSAESEPLIITDCDALRRLDSSGYLYEYIPPREDWEQRLERDGAGYDDFVRRRLVSIAGMYGLASVPE
jgi:hypothetical protein